MYSSNMQRLIDAVQTQPGMTETEERQAIVAYGRALTLGEQSDSEPVPALVPYLSKAVKHAYKITDADVERLGRAGYSEDEIFELTIAAALGASLARLERGFSLVDGGVQ